MALSKVTYVNGETVITAENLNAIQDEIVNKLPDPRAVINSTYMLAATVDGEGECTYSWTDVIGDISSALDAINGEVI